MARWIIVLVCCVYTTVDAARRNGVDVTDEPSREMYRKNAGYKLNSYTMGPQLRNVTPRQCAAECNTQQRCMGFNYRLDNNRCELLKHNVFTVFRGSSISERDLGYALFSRIGMTLYCPEAGFRDPFKERCYEVIEDEALNWRAARHRCADEGGSLLMIPDHATYYALWNDISRRMTTPSVWLGLQSRRGAMQLRRKGQRSPFRYYDHLRRQPEELPRRKRCGMLLANGDMDVTDCNERMAFICEYRPRNDNELNELCPEDSVAHDDTCYWSEDMAETFDEAEDACAERGGTLAAITSEPSAGFLHHMWYDVIGAGVDTAWVGLVYDQGNWHWSYNGMTLEATNDDWVGGEQPLPAASPSCAKIKRGPNSLKYQLGVCNENGRFMCMGLAGRVRSRQCHRIRCPDNSVCVEGTMVATCQCMDGFVASTTARGRLRCKSSTVCQATGDPHYLTWDGLKVHYQGLCRHILTETCTNSPTGPEGALPAFQVRVNNYQRPDKARPVSFTEWVELEVYGIVVKAKGLTGQVWVNGEERYPEFELVPFNDHRYISVRITRKRRWISTDFGLVIKTGRHRVRVSLSNEYQGEMCGLCGDWDGDQSNDEVPDGSIYMLPEDRDSENCQIPEGPVCSDEEREAAEQSCSIIHTLHGISQCRASPATSLSGFFDDCVEDVCAGGPDNVQDSVCDTLESLTQYCTDMGQVVDSSWRQESGCEMECEANLVYNPQMSLDVATCSNPEAQYEISAGVGEDCQCPEGYVLEGEECILPQQCGCTIEVGDEVIYMERDTSMMNEDCTAILTCEGFGEPTSTTVECVDNAECSLDDDGIRGCNCIEGTTGDGLVECTTEGCPYPMPGDPDFPAFPIPGPSGRQQTGPQSRALHPATGSSGAAAMQPVAALGAASSGTAAHVDEPSGLKLRNLLSTPELPIVMMPPDSHLMNPNCQIVDCLIGNNYVESEPQCGENAYCRRNSEGVYGCECLVGYTGDPLVRCDPPPCSYQFPGSPTLTILDEGQTILDENCNRITCTNNALHQSDRSGCSTHAQCVQTNDVTYVCDCDTGYVLDGSGDCIEDSSGTGDPHFMVTSHLSGERLCFDAHGEHGDVLKLIEDQYIDLQVNGELFGVNATSAADPHTKMSYFRAIAVLTDDESIILDQDYIRIDNYAVFRWGDTFDEQKGQDGVSVRSLPGYLVEVKVAEGVTLQVTRVKSKDIGYYMGVYVIHSDGFSPECTGVIGQFIKNSFSVSHVNHDTEETGTLTMHRSGTSVPVHLDSRYNHAHRGAISCWFYKTNPGDDQLLGRRADYTVPKLSYKPF